MLLLICSLQCSHAVILSLFILLSQHIFYCQVIERAMQHSENCYKVPNVRIVGKICKTNLPPNTAFRGYGGPQGMLVAEHWIDDVAAFLQLPADKVAS